MNIRNRSMSRLRRIVLDAVVICAIPGALHAAQGASGSTAPLAAQAEPVAAIEYPRVTLTAGRSTVLTTDFDITRIAVTNPAVADAVPIQSREVLIDGKAHLQHHLLRIVGARHLEHVDDVRLGS